MPHSLRTVLSVILLVSAPARAERGENTVLIDDAHLWHVRAIDTRDGGSVSTQLDVVVQEGGERSAWGGPAKPGTGFIRARWRSWPTTPRAPSLPHGSQGTHRLTSEGLELGEHVALRITHWNGGGEALRTEFLFWLDDQIVLLGSWRGPPPTVTASHDPLTSPPVIFVESRTQRTTLRFDPEQRKFVESQPAPGLRTPRSWSSWRPVLVRANADANDFDDLSGQAERRRRRTWLEAREDLGDHGRRLRSRVDAHRASIDALAPGPIRFRLQQACNAAHADVKRIEKTATCLAAAIDGDAVGACIAGAPMALLLDSGTEATVLPERPESWVRRIFLGSPIEAAALKGLSWSELAAVAGVLHEIQERTTIVPCVKASRARSRASFDADAGVVLMEHEGWKDCVGGLRSGSKVSLLPEWRRDSHRTELSPTDVDAIARAIRAAAGVP